MNRLPNGILPCLTKETGIPAKTLSDYVTTTKRPGGRRSIALEEACKNIGLEVSCKLWVRGTSKEIKAALSTPIPNTD